LENGVNDVAGSNLDQPIRVAALFNGGRLELYPLGTQPDKPPLVTRGIVDGEMIWQYGPFKVTMRRVEDLEEHDGYTERHQGESTKDP